MSDNSASGNGFGSRPEAINRSGRPSPAADFRSLVLAALAQERGGKVRARALADKLVTLAVAGDLEAARLLLGYAYGRPGLMPEATPEGGLRDLVLVADGKRLSMSEWAARMHTPQLGGLAEAVARVSPVD